MKFYRFLGASYIVCSIQPLLKDHVITVILHVLRTPATRTRVLGSGSRRVMPRSHRLLRWRTTVLRRFRWWNLTSCRCGECGVQNWRRLALFKEIGCFWLVIGYGLWSEKWLIYIYIMFNYVISSYHITLHYFTLYYSSWTVEKIFR